MLHGSMKWLFFRKNKIKATYYIQRKRLFTRVYKIGDLKKKTHNFLAEKTAVERDGIPRPVD